VCRGAHKKENAGGDPPTHQSIQLRNAKLEETKTRPTQEGSEAGAMFKTQFVSVAMAGVGLLLVLGLAASKVSAHTEEADVAGRQALESSALGFAILGFAMMST